MIADTLSRPVRRFLVNRLERLHESLEKLGQRLRESIAQIIGNEIGDAVRDALETALQTRSTSSFPDRRLYEDRRYDRRDPERGYPQEGYPDSNFWNDHEPIYEEPEELPKPSRWKSLLAGLVQLGAWWLKVGKRPSLKKVLGVGAAVGFASLVAGPLAGGMVMAFGTTILMTRMADTASSAAEKLASLPPE